jgi:hypothetical protein
MGRAVPALAHPRVHDLVALRRVDAGEAPGDLLRESGHTGVEPHEVRREDDGRLGAFEFFQRARERDAPAHDLGWRMPQPAPVEPRLAHEDVDLARDALALGFAPLREARAQVDVHDAPARPDDVVQRAPEQPAEPAHPRQGQQREEAHEEDAEVAEDAHAACRGSL